MKRNRIDELNALSKNINLYLNDKESKVLVFTSDLDALNIENIINEIGNILANEKKILVVSYDEFSNKNSSLNYLVLDPLNKNYDEIINNFNNYDVVLVCCPNVLKFNYHLHIAHFATDTIIYTKQFKSKVKNIQYIKEILTNKEFNILGIINQKIM